ncbi:MAG: ABC transporter permease [Christensenellales bacterium]
MKSAKFKNQIWKRALPLYLMLAVPLLWYVIFCYIPMSGLIIAFEDYNVFVGFGSPWLTDAEGNIDIFGHFREFLSDPYFWQVFYNTFRLGFWNTLVCFPAPIILALMFNELAAGKFKKVTQTLSYLPYFVSTVALVSIIFTMLSYRDGIVNNIIVAFGGNRINFISEPSWFVPIYVILNLWRSVGWGTIIYIAAMANINQTLYEAASLDGAGRFRKIWNITLPSIKPTVIVMFILAVPGILGADFEAVLLLQLDQNLQVSDIVSTYVYRRSIGSSSGLPRYDYSTAIGLFFSVISLILIVISNKIANKTADVGLY